MAATDGFWRSVLGPSGTVQPKKKASIGRMQAMLYEIIRIRLISSLA